MRRSRLQPLEVSIDRENNCLVCIAAVTYIITLANGIVAAILCGITQNTEIHGIDIWNHMLGIAITGCASIIIIVCMMYAEPLVLKSHTFTIISCTCLSIISFVQFSMKGFYNDLSQDQINSYNEISMTFMKSVEIFGNTLSIVNICMGIGFNCIFGCYRICRQYEQQTDGYEMSSIRLDRDE